MWNDIKPPRYDYDSGDDVRNGDKQNAIRNWKKNFVISVVYMIYKIKNEMENKKKYNIVCR